MKITAMSLTNGTLTVIVDNGDKILTAKRDHPAWDKLVESYKNGNENILLSLFTTNSFLKEYSVGNLSIIENTVLYCGVPLHTVDANRVLAFMQDRLPYEPLANYINLKMQNPSQRAVQEMYSFLEHKNIPLTKDGYFVAYKGVGDDYYSRTAGNEPLESGTRNSEGKILNKVGEHIRMVRSYVNDNHTKGCSGSGLYVGSLKYASGFGPRVVLVEVNPADVVSVPSDSNCQKMRVCAYTVVGEYSGPLPEAYAPEFSSESEVGVPTSGPAGVSVPDESGYEEDDVFAYSDDLDDEETESADDKDTDTLTKDLVDDENFQRGMKEGVGDFVANNDAVYEYGDEEAADSVPHSNYIKGYLTGFYE
jgi:hypothetical protein